MSDSEQRDSKHEKSGETRSSGALGHTRTRQRIARGGARGSIDHVDAEELQGVTDDPGNVVNDPGR